jgi:hypothetical protein
VLSGTLDAFGLPDVFSLLAMTKKTGRLRITTAKTSGWLEFRDGEIAYAVSDTRRMALASRLLGSGVVDDTQLRHIVAAQRGGALALTRALLDDGVVDGDAFDALVREQIQDAVFELMRQSDGSFAFEAMEPGEDGAAPRITVSTEQLVSEGTRRLREWEEITSHVVSFDAIVTLAPHPPSGSVTVSMDAVQWRLLTFVDGRRTVRDLVDLTGQGEYATCQVIAGLTTAGLVEVVDPSVGGRTGVAELVARHDLLRRLEERELGAGAGRRGRPPEPDARRPAPSEPPRQEAPRPPPPAPAGRETPAAREAPVDLPDPPGPWRERAGSLQGRLVAQEPAPAEAPESGATALEAVAPDPLAEEPDAAVEVADPLTEEPAAEDGEGAAGDRDADDEDYQDEPESAARHREDAGARGHDRPEGEGGYEDDEAFDRAEVERELASLGYRDDEDLNLTNPFRLNRPDDPNRGLLHRLMDGRKQN